MKKILLLTLAAASVSAYGQGLRIGSYYHRQQRQKAELRKNISKDDMSTKQNEKKGSLLRNVYLDQATKVTGDNIYRYVFTYNKNMERSSETIYKKHFNGASWSDEELYTKGTYSYEYDMFGRIVNKTVKYDRYTSEFDSYCVHVNYNDALDYTDYTREILQSDDSWYRDSEWSFWNNGKLRHHTKYEGESGRQQEVYSVAFDEKGNCNKIANRSYCKELEGNLNDSIAKLYNGDYSDGTFSQTSIENYVYNPENGKLAVYKSWDDNSYDSRKIEYVYDDLGRISAIKKYYDEDDEDAGVDYPKGAKRKSVDDNYYYYNEPKWRLEYNETYTYFKDEVYGIGNPWHDVFGFDGPLTNRHLVDDDYEEGTPWVEDLTFNRDANGKLLSVVFTRPEEEGIVEKNTFDVDADGHITREYYLSNEENCYIDETTTDYNWQGDLLTSSKETYTYKGGSYENTYVRDYVYSYGDGVFNYKRTSTDTNGDNNSVVTGTVSKANKGFKIVEKHDNFEDRFIQEVQTEDVSFIRPNLVCDYKEFSTDSTIVVSVKDRVVAYTSYSYGSHNTGSGFKDISFSLADIETYFNTYDDTYFSVSHEDDKTICSNMKGLPVFILQGDRLLKEYIYEDVYYSNEADTRAAKSSTGQAYIYKEIEYRYDEYGRVNGQTVTSYDKDGKKVDGTTVEVTYNPSSGIETVNASTENGISLNGRTLGISNGSFSVYSVDGTMLGSDAQIFQFQKGGTYIVKAASGKTIKINVK